MTLPHGWEMTPLGEVADIVMGQSPDSKLYSEEEVGLPFLQGCAEFGGAFPRHKLFCSQRKKLAPSGSILFSVRAPVGKLNVADRDYVIGRGLASISGTIVTTQYLKHFLQFEADQFRVASQGSTFEAINSTELSRWPVLHPMCMEEQKKIAQVLSTVDRAIEQTEALIAKQQRIKTGLMRDLLTRGIDEHGNLRSEQTHQFKDSPVGRIPVEWEIGIGSDYFTLRAGIEIEGVSQSPEGNSLYLKVDDLNAAENLNGILFSENTFDCAGSLTTRLLQPGTIVFPKRGAAIFLNRVALLCKRATLDPNLMGLCTKPGTSPQYFRLVLLRRNLGMVCDNSGIPQINNKHLYPLMFAIPDIDEQDRVVTQIHQSEKLLHEHLQQVLKLRSVKTALMQDLLTGNRRVHSGKTKLPVVQQRPWHCRRKGMKKGRWTPVEQKQMIGSAMAIATTANLLLGLRGTKIGKKYTDLMVKQAGMDKELCDAGTKYILIPMLPFAVELCLKGIKAQGANEFIWTHNLKSLWEDLNKKEQAEVRKRAEDPAWRKEERKQRKAFGITGKMRKVDEVIEAHQNDFEDWRYVADGVKKLTKKRKALRIDEAFMDLFRIVHACVEFHKERDKK